MLEAELMERDHWTRDNLLSYQQGRLRSLLAHAVNQSPYYREVLGADAAERPLAELPALPKATLMAEFDRVVSRRLLRLGSTPLCTTRRACMHVLAQGAAEGVGERLRGALLAAIAATGAVPPEVYVEPVTALPREPGGKLRLVRSA
jgi:hypothetical protein